MLINEPFHRCPCGSAYMIKKERVLIDKSVDLNHVTPVELDKSVIGRSVTLVCAECGRPMARAKETY